MKNTRNKFRRQILLCVVIFCCSLNAMVQAQSLSQSEAKTNQKQHTILELYQLAIQHDMRFQASQAKFEAASLNPSISRAQLLPQISLRANRNTINDEKVRGPVFTGDPSNISNDIKDFNYRTENQMLSLRQSLFNRKYYIELSQSRSIAERAVLELKTARHDLITRLTEAYFLVVDAQAQLRFSKAEKEAVERQLEQAQLRFEVGKAAITDVKEAEASYDLATADEILNEKNLSVSLSKLSVIINQDVDKLSELSEAAPIIPPHPADAEQWIETALRQNPDLLAQKLTANIARDEVKRQRAEHFPTLDAYAQRREHKTEGRAPRQFSVRGTEVGVELQIPLFTGGSAHYRTKQAAHTARENQKRLEEMHRSVKQQAREFYLNVIASISRVKALMRAVESAQLAYESNEIGFEVGTRSSVDVLLAVEELFSAKSDYTQARHRYITDLVNLKKVAGTLSEQDINQINQWLN